MLLMFLGGVIFLSFLSAELFEKTRVPESLVLMGLGVALREAGFVDPAMLEPVTPLVTGLAAAIIMFESGMGIELHKLDKFLQKTLKVTSLSLLTNTAAVALMVRWFYGWDPLTSTLAGFLLGGTSAAVVIPIARKLLGEEGESVIKLEATLNNAYNFVFTMSIAHLIAGGSASPRLALARLTSYSLTGGLLGAALAVVAVKLLEESWDKPFSYMRALAAAVVTYGFAEYAGGSGAVAGLVFGLVLGNNAELSGLTRMPIIGTGRLERFSREIAFLMRTYFFLTLGIVLEVPWMGGPWLLASLIAVVSLALRWASARLSGIPPASSLMVSRGLGEAVLASLVVGTGVPHANALLKLTSLVIVTTNILPTLVLLTLGKHLKQKRTE